MAYFKGAMFGWGRVYVESSIIKLVNIRKWHAHRVAVYLSGALVANHQNHHVVGRTTCGVGQPCLQKEGIQLRWRCVSGQCCKHSESSRRKLNATASEHIKMLESKWYTRILHICNQQIAIKIAAVSLLHSWATSFSDESQMPCAPCSRFTLHVNASFQQKKQW